jgi:hypothetical protein
MARLCRPAWRLVQCLIEKVAISAAHKPESCVKDDPVTAFFLAQGGIGRA